jgi:hypothetical protein
MTPMTGNHNNSPDTAGVTIRRLHAEDLPTVRRLAGLDSREQPQFPLLGAEVEGTLLAVISLANGESVADPFSRTQELRALLELRAAQLRRRENARRRRWPQLRRDLRTAALGGSPPGAPGWLIARRPRPF